MPVTATPTPAPEPVIPDVPHWYDWSQLSDTIITWAPILFMLLIVYFLWRTMTVSYTHLTLPTN